MNYLESGQKPASFISSEYGTSQELVKVKYTRVQRESPEFMTTYEGIDQSVEVALATIVLSAQPEPVVAMYDFLMSTFVSNSGQPSSPPPPAASERHTAIAPQIETTARSSQSDEQIRVKVQLQGVKGNYYHTPMSRKSYIRVQ